MPIESILKPGRGGTPPGQAKAEPTPAPNEPSPPAAPSPESTPVVAQPEPAPAPQPMPAQATPQSNPAPPTSVAAALSANPSARSDYRAMGSWLASGSTPPVTVAATVPAIASEAAQAAGPTRDAILRDAWGAVLSQANVSRAEVIELLR